MVFDPPGITPITLARIQIALGLIALAGLCYFSSCSSSSPTVSEPDQHFASPLPPLLQNRAQQNKVQQNKHTLSDSVQPGNPVELSDTVDAPEQKEFQDLQYTIKPGDTLEAIFKQKQFSVTELYEIMEADEPYLQMGLLRRGDELIFRVDQSNALHALSLIVDPSKTVRYVRGEDGFVYEELLTPKVRVTEVARGVISGNFFASATGAGLSGNVVMTVNQLLKNSLNFHRDLRAGDLFQVVMERETIDGQAIDKDRLLAARIQSRGKDYGAYLHHDGSYYDARGDSLVPALLRFPTQKQFRISSHFNPRRLHPVTGRYKPHNGVDFAMSTGTPVIATGNGRVTRVAEHRFAGKYIVIDQFGPYKTRYLHLSKILVTRGQQVERGQVIGLSGNTGRSTGPHLHYELHINGKPVNPMTADIPMLKSISNDDTGNFRLLVQRMQGLMLEDNNLVNRYEIPATDDQQPREQNNSDKSSKWSAADPSTPS